MVPASIYLWIYEHVANIKNVIRTKLSKKKKEIKPVKVIKQGTVYVKCLKNATCL